MIIKSKSYKHSTSFTTVVKYVLKEENKILLTRFIRGGKRQSPEHISKQFYHNEQHRIYKRKNAVKLYMEILSFHKDNAKDLTDTKLKKIAQKYILLRAKKSMAMATIHRDKAHTHLHILLSGTQYKTGRSIRIEKSEFQKIKQQMEVYQKQRFPELQQSAIFHQPSSKKKR